MHGRNILPLTIAAFEFLQLQVVVGEEKHFLYSLRLSPWGPVNWTNKGQINQRKGAQFLFLPTQEFTERK